VSFWRLIWRNLRFHWLLNAAVVAGISLAVTVVVGALVAGDSLRASLGRVASERRGRISYSIRGPSGGLTVQLAGSLAAQLEVPVAPVTELAGAVQLPGNDHSLGKVRIIGIDEQFGLVFGLAQWPPPGLNEVYLNDVLAGKLGVSAGDDLVFILERARSVSADAPLIPIPRRPRTLRLRVARIISSDEGGGYNLRTELLRPRNAFVALETLQRALDKDGWAGELLLGVRSDGSPVPASKVQEAIAGSWQPEDGGLRVRTVRKVDDRQVMQLESAAVFLPDSQVSAFTSPEIELRVFTYLANTLASGGQEVPYSLVAGLGDERGFHPLIPDLADDEVVVNEWLAKALDISAGAILEMRYFIGAGGQQTETSAEFKVRAVVPMEGLGADPELMPDFPGLHDAEKCRDWTPGIPIDLSRVRPEDERYWDDWKGAPKATFTLAAAQRMWGTRFGSVTALRLTNSGQFSVDDWLQERLTPGQVGLVVSDVRGRAERAVSQALDFGMMVLGFGFFLVGAALTLVALLLALNMARRHREAGLLLAVGFSPARVRRLYLGEGLLLVLLSVIPGAAGGIFFGSLMVELLGGIWSSNAPLLDVSVNPGSVLLGLVSGAVVAIVALFMAMRRVGRRSPVSLLSGQQTMAGARSLRPWPFVLAGAVLSAAAVTFFAVTSAGPVPPDVGYFGGGAVLLAALLSMLAAWLRQRSGARTGKVTMVSLMVRNLARQRVRTLTAIGLVSVSSFLIIAADAHRQSNLEDLTAISSGTGGYDLWGETVIPLVRPMVDLQSWEELGVSADAKRPTEFTAFRVRVGDDASCLNPNRAQEPQVLGAPVSHLAQMGRFTFSGFADGVRPDGWQVLAGQVDTGAIPAVADINTILWALGRQVGDEIEVTGGDGKPVRLKLVGALQNTVLQGNVIIAEEHFCRIYPAVEGFRLFLVDGAKANSQAAKTVSDALGDHGWDAMAAPDRLAEFNLVLNTYLSVFQILALLALVLGSFGLGIVLLRNAVERRGELALMQALGFSQSQLRRFLLLEHLTLLFTGLGCGLVAALAATLPLVWSRGQPVPLGTLQITVILVLISGMLWTWSGARVALRGRLLDVLTKDR
jgi:putative ABC transport system permease protein